MQMDAALMEGRDLQAGAVAAIEGVRHPISIARLLLPEPTVMLVGPDARRYAAARGAELCDPEAMITQEARQAWQERQRGPGGRQANNNTVGCVALDARGELACGTSTGGTGENPPGRVGDSPLLGCGLYADTHLGACSLTGEGEQIMRVLGAAGLMERLRDGEEPEGAARRFILHMERRVGGEAGCILLDRHGRIGWAHNAANMAVAYLADGMTAPNVFLHKQEEIRTEGSQYAGTSR